MEEARLVEDSFGLLLRCGGLFWRFYSRRRITQIQPSYGGGGEEEDGHKLVESTSFRHHFNEIALNSLVKAYREINVFFGGLLDKCRK